MSISLQKVVGGKYEIVEKIKEGGTGVIYKVRHRLLDEEMVIKVLRGHLAFDGEMAQRFLNEAKNAIRLHHRNIARIHDFSVDADQGIAFIVMEFIDGLSLEELLQDFGRPSLPLAIEISQQFLSALGYLHDHGIVHRDVAADNIMLSRDENGEPLARLIDLGIAKGETTATSITRTGVYLGKFYYSSPEQFSTDSPQVEARSDLYSFGVLLYRLLTGEYPVRGDSLPSLAAGHLFKDPVPFSETDPEDNVPQGLRQLVLQSLAKDLKDRIGSASLFSQALAEFSGTGPYRQELDAIFEAVESRRAPSVRQTEPGSTQNRIDEHFRAEDQTAQALEPTPAGNRREGPPTTRRILKETLAIETAAEPPTVAEEQVQTGTVIAPHASLKRAAPVPLPARLGRRFTLHEAVAQGRTGRLYKAYDRVLGKLVGVKVIDEPSGLTEKRQFRGAGIWLGLQHPNLLQVLHVDPGDEGRPALIATELIDGIDLGRASTQKQFSLEEKLAIVIQLCDAIAYMHSKGVVHREVKPSNILVSSASKKVTLLDSGIARRANPDSYALTQAGNVVGDLNYMAPEQAAGRFDERSDIFSVGAVLYELLTGRQPSFRQLERMRTEISEKALPRRLQAAALRALSFEPEARFSRAEEMADELRYFVPNESPPADLSRLVATLHGIRTHARWQRAFSEVASGAGLECRLDRWNFGYFSVLRFLLPWARRAKVPWLRQTYHEEFGEQAAPPLGEKRPSIVAHSFGTYILGNALLRYPYLRFNRVLLCGSVLPTDFPWPDLIDRGQVQAVRNEVGSRDLWTGLVRWFVPGTGPSGVRGFQQKHPRLFQERFSFAHSEYFEKGHMKDKWVPFLKSRMSFVTPQDREVKSPASKTPWALYLLYAIAAVIGGLAIRQFLV